MWPFREKVSVRPTIEYTWKESADGFFYYYRNDTGSVVGMVRKTGELWRAVSSILEGFGAFPRWLDMVFVDEESAKQAIKSHISRACGLQT